MYTKKFKFILFSEKVYKILIQDGYHTLSTLGLTNENRSPNSKRIRFEGYLLEVGRFRIIDTNGKLVYRYDNPEILKYYRTGIHNGIIHGRMVTASPDVKITERDIEFPLKDDKVKEMYRSRTIKFYIRLDVGYNKSSIRRTNFHLYKKLASRNTKFPRILIS